VQLSAPEADRLRHGQTVTTPAPGCRPGLARVYGPGGVFLGLGEADGQGRLAPRRLFNLPGAEGP
jgi:hypothetical protein